MGDLGWVNSESLSKNILKAIENLGINEVSNPIVSSNTILFIKITDKKVLKLDKKYWKFKKENFRCKKNQRFNLYSNSHLSKLKNLSLIKYQWKKKF